MKKLFLMATMLLMFGAVNAQIGDCSVKGSRVEIYDADGRYKAYFALSSGTFVKNVAGSNIMVKNGSRIETYDKDGRYVTYRTE